MTAVHLDLARMTRQAARALAFVSGLLFLMWPGMGMAQTTATPEQEYKKLIKVNEDIQPLGDTPFGEKISLYDGSLSFTQNDVTLTGTGPTITVGREFSLHGVEDRPDLQYRAFGDWDIALPQIFTVTANQNNVTGWRVAAGNQNAICTNFGPPPSVAAPNGDSERADWEPQTWWQGYQLRIPGQGSQDLLSRSAANTAAPTVNGLNYPIVTRGNWAVGCLPQASNDATLEGFLAIGPDGTKYWLDHIAYRYMPSLTRPLDSGPLSLRMQANGVFKPQAADQDFVTRREGRMLVSRIEDRFGNYVIYGYSGDDVVDIAASDGRHVTITYQTDPATGTSSHRISTVTVQGGTAGTRTWTYNYVKSTANLVYTLTSVTQPDGSSFGYNLDPFNGAWVDTRESGGTCGAIGVPGNLDHGSTATMTHPSGLSGSFTVAPLKRGRANVPQVCMSGPNIPALPNYPGTWAAMPNASYSMAITSKVLSGAGLPSGGLAWSYGYSPANESWAPSGPAVTCSSTVYTDVTYPADSNHVAGHAERSTFSNCYDWTESQLTQEAVFEGANDSAIRRLTTYGYVNPAAQTAPGADARSVAYAHPWGYVPQQRVNRTQLEEQSPKASQQIVLDPAGSATPDTHTWTATAFDAFARARDVTRASNFGFSVSERLTFTDSTALWVIGLPAQSINLTRNETVSQMDYNPATLTPATRYQFGAKVMDYTFNAQGQLASFTDPLAHTTTLAGYVLGIPTIITFPDQTPDHPNGTSESLTVDGFGQIASITDQAGATTSYSYDAMGRLTQTNYPVNDSVAWAPKVINYTFSADARGLGGNHWVRTVTQGSYAERVDFDAMLRPLMTGKAEGGTGALFVSTQTEYDWAGRKVLESYAVDGAPDRASAPDGVSTTYDVLGRELTRTQSAEVAGVATTTAYLPGGVRRVTDPNGNVVDSANQAFDAPVYDKPVSVTTSDGVNPVVQTIVRNVYGNPEQISQGGVVRKLFYDPQQRLCRTFDPETQSEMTAYDAAGNAVWTASGQPVSGDVAGCGYDQVASAARVSRTFDGMNRPATVTYPGGTVGVAFTYDPLGNPATAIATTSTANPNNTGTVNWAFGRNKRGMLTAEVLSIGSMSWGIGYGYDANGNLASTQYPDGKVVTAAPNALGQPTSAGTYATAATYHPDGQLKSFAFGNGALFSMTPNTRKLIGNFSFGTASGIAVSEDLVYDRNANITAVNDVTAGQQRSRTLAYDGLNRLSSATAGALWGTESYTYDAANNIRSVTNSSGTNTYTYDTVNRLQSISGVTPHTFQYDVQGNTTKRDSQVMVFDLANRLLSVTGKGDYLYDSAGRRVRSVSPSGTTYYAYNAAGQLLWQFDPASQTGTDYVYLGKKLVASTSGTASTSTVPVLSAPGSALVNASYTVSWTAVSGATSYELQEQPTGGAWTTIATGTALSKAVTHAAAGTFRYQVRACTVGVCGAYSAPATTIVSLTNTAPPAPTNLLLTLSADERSIIISWGAATRATSYSAQFINGSSWTDVYSGASLSTSVPTPAADGTYSFRVQACNSAGCSIFATSGGLVVRHTPAAPASINVPATSSGLVTISWPSSPYAVTYYLDQSSDGITFVNVWSSAALSTTRNITVTGTYYFRVHACNADKCGGYGPTGASTVTIPPSQASQITVPGTNYTGCYTVAWTASAGATTYVLQEKVNNGSFSTILSGSARSTDICGKGNGSYSYRVQACNAGGCGPFGGVASVVVVLPPSPPGSVTVTKALIGANTYRFTGSWAAVSDAQRYEVLSGTTTAYNGGATSFVLQSGSSQTLNGSFGVRACNQAGCSAYVAFSSP